MKTFFIVATLITAPQVAVAWPTIHPVSSGRHNAALRSSSTAKTKTTSSSHLSARRYSLKTTSLNISASSMGGLLVRGGGAIESYYGDALGYFGGIRIPASFLAGTSLAAIFIRKGLDKQGTPLEKNVLKFYHLSSLSAFLLSMNTIITATVAYTSILHGRFNDVAETAYMLLKREFEYEFVTVRWSFITSMFCFLGMVASRLLIEFELLKENKSKDMAILSVCSVGALASHLLSYVNQTLWCWKSYPLMTVYLAKLLMNRAFVDRRPLQIVSVLLSTIATFYLGKLAVQEDIKEGA